GASARPARCKSKSRRWSPAATCSGSNRSTLIASGTSTSRTRSTRSTAASRQSSNTTESHKKRLAIGYSWTAAATATSSSRARARPASTSTSRCSPISRVTIHENAIDYVVADPFVNCARFAENDNNKMAAIIEAWAAIGERQNCAIGWPHHVRKGASGGRNEGHTVEDARGAGALVNSCRNVRVLNTMTKDEGEKAGVERHRSYFRIDNGKANLTPP